VAGHYEVGEPNASELKSSE